MSLTLNKVEDLVIQSKIHLDTRPIKRLLKAVSMFLERATRDEENLNLELLNFDLLLKKFHLLQEFSSRQNLEFKTLETLTDCEILKIQDEILNLKSDLEKSLEIKTRKISYDSIAKSIKKISSRDKSDRKMKRLEKEIQKLQQENDLLVKAKEFRRDKLQILVSTMHDFQDEILLLNTEKNDDLEDVSEDDEEDLDLMEL